MTQPKKTLSPVQLEAELNHMKEYGFEKTDFAELLKKFELNEVLAHLAGEDRIDQRSLKKSLASVAYRMLMSQATRYYLQNPEINFLFANDFFFSQILKYLVINLNTLENK